MWEASLGTSLTERSSTGAIALGVMVRLAMAMVKIGRAHV